MALAIHPFMSGGPSPGIWIPTGVSLQAGDAIAVGEIGLTTAVNDADRERGQAFFFSEQLKIARINLPVILHIRRTQDDVLKHLRRARRGGIAHAFNGSIQQASQFIDLGSRLGFGGNDL